MVLQAQGDMPPDECGLQPRPSRRIGIYFYLHRQHLISLRRKAELIER